MNPPEHSPRPRSRPRPAPRSTAELAEAALAGAYGRDPAETTVTSAFWLHHTTRLAGGGATYHNHYLLLRAGLAFGACAFEAGELPPHFCESASGRPLGDLLQDENAPVRTAALDAFLAGTAPHGEAAGAERIVLPAGTPEVRARARDAAIAGLLGTGPGTRVALIGVVGPLAAAIREQGGVLLPCDLNLRVTDDDRPVTDDMTAVLPAAEAVVATGMTIGNGTFDLILGHCREQGVPLVVYAQTGSAVAREFLGAGVTALCAEPFPFSQFSADPTPLYRYAAGDRGGSAGPVRPRGAVL